MELQLNAPAGWADTTAAQRRDIFEILATADDADAAKTLLVLKWNRVRVIGRTADGGWLVRQGRKPITVRGHHLAAVVSSGLAYIETPPASPYDVAVPSFGKARGVDAMMVGEPFENYLAVENFYQGYLATRRDDLLDAAAELIYPGCHTPLEDWQRVALFYRLAAMKRAMAAAYPDLYSPAGADDGLGRNPAAQVVEAMNAQIRALTKGDITKEREVLAMPTERALTELNAQAREAREISQKYGNK